MIRPNHLAYHTLSQYLFPWLLPGVTRATIRHHQSTMAAAPSHPMGLYAVRTRRPRVPIPSRRIFHPRFETSPYTAAPPTNPCSHPDLGQSAAGGVSLCIFVTLLFQFDPLDDLRNAGN